MGKEEYLAKRKELLDEAQKLIDAGKTNEAQEKMDEAKKLDENFNTMAEAQANLRALSNNQPIMIPVEGKTDKNETQMTEQQKVLAAWDSEEYKTAWYKDIVGQPKTKAEQETFTMVNEAYTHTTGNTGIVIPKTVARGIWEIAGEMYPYFDAVSKSYVSGTFSMIQDDTSSDAGWYDEGEDTADGKDTFKEFTLSGCELSRAVTISWKLKEMAMDEFIPFMQRKLAKKMGSAASYGVMRGAGPKGAKGDNKKPEPTGVVTALKAENGTPQVVEYEGNITYANITAARSKIKSGYAGNNLKVYANSNTIWTQLANILDGNKKPIFMPDAMTGGFRILGMEVKEDDSCADGDVLMSNAPAGYHLNTNKEMSILAEEHIKARKTDYCGYAIMDGNTTTTKAHALITKKAAAASE